MDVLKSARLCFGNNNIKQLKLDRSKNYPLKKLNKLPSKRCCTSTLKYLNNKLDHSK